MLIPRSSECIHCSNIMSLLSKIDCKLAELAKAEYNNVIYALNKCVQDTQIGDLLNYKRILTYKAANQNYACEFTVNMIASKIALYGLKDCSCAKYGRFVDDYTNNSAGTTTTSYPPQSTTTTSTTININSPLSFYYGIPICLYGYGNDCYDVCNGFNPIECTTFYVSPLCAVNLSIGCILYLDNLYTTPADRKSTRLNSSHT